jgi:phosphatidylserine synthase
MITSDLPLVNNKQRIEAARCSVGSDNIKIKTSIFQKIKFFIVFPIAAGMIFMLGKGPARVPYSETTQNIALFFSGLLMFAWLTNLVLSKWLQIDIKSKEYLVKIGILFYPITINRFSLAGARSLKIVNVDYKRYDLIVVLQNSQFFLVSAPSPKKAINWAEKISRALHINLESETPS